MTIVAEKNTARPKRPFVLRHAWTVGICSLALTLLGLVTLDYCLTGYHIALRQSELQQLLNSETLVNIDSEPYDLLLNNTSQQFKRLLNLSQLVAQADYGQALYTTQTAAFSRLQDREKLVDGLNELKALSEKRSVQEKALEHLNAQARKLQQRLSPEPAPDKATTLKTDSKPDSDSVLSPTERLAKLIEETQSELQSTKQELREKRDSTLAILSQTLLHLTAQDPKAFHVMAYQALRPVLHGLHLPTPDLVTLETALIPTIDDSRTAIPENSAHNVGNAKS